MKNRFLKEVILIAIVALFASCTQAPVPAPSTIDKIVNNQKIIVGTTGNQFPFSYKDDKGQLAGIDIRIAKYLASELGVKAEFKLIPFDQLISSVKTGDVDIVFSGVSATPKRNLEVAFPGVYYKSGKSILSSNETLYKGKKVDVNKKEVTLGARAGTTSEAFIAKNYPNATLKTASSFQASVDMLNAGEIDGLVTDFETAELIGFAFTEKNYMYKNLSDITEQEFISPVVASGDPLFINLITNFVERIATFDEYMAVDLEWLNYLN